MEDKGEFGGLKNSRELLLTGNIHLLECLVHVWVQIGECHQGVMKGSSGSAIMYTHTALETASK